MLLIELSTLSVCGIIAIQDFRERTVTWICFPLLGILLAMAYALHTSFERSFPFMLANLVLVTGVLLVLLVYTRLIAHKKFLNVSFGLGDLLFFYAFALGFPTMTFLVLFVSSILFSLLIFLLLKSSLKMESVPLAGLMGVFLILIFTSSFFPMVPSLYIY